MKDWLLLLSWCVEFVDFYTYGGGLTWTIAIVDMDLHGLFKCNSLDKQIFDNSLIQTTPLVYFVELKLIAF